MKDAKTSSELSLIVKELQELNRSLRLLNETMKGIKITLMELPWAMEDEDYAEQLLGIALKEEYALEESKRVSRKSPPWATSQREDF